MSEERVLSPDGKMKADAKDANGSANDTHKPKVTEIIFVLYLFIFFAPHFYPLCLLSGPRMSSDPHIHPQHSGLFLCCCCFLFFFTVFNDLFNIYHCECFPYRFVLAANCLEPVFWQPKLNTRAWHMQYTLGHKRAETCKKSHTPAFDFNVIFIARNQTRCKYADLSELHLDSAQLSNNQMCSLLFPPHSQLFFRTHAPPSHPLHVFPL